MKSYIFSVFVMAALFCVSCTKKGAATERGEARDSASVAQVATEPGDRGYIVAVGDMAPDFEVAVDDGSSFRLSDYRGKVVMLQFTASWCGICRREMPYIERDIYGRFGSRGDFCLLGIDREETEEKVARLKEVTGVSYPIGYDRDGAVFRLYAHPEAGITRNVLIDREGRIVMLTRRFEEREFEALCEKIGELVEK